MRRSEVRTSKTVVRRRFDACAVSCFFLVMVMTQY